MKILFMTLLMFLYVIPGFAESSDTLFSKSALTSMVKNQELNDSVSNLLVYTTLPFVIKNYRTHENVVTYRYMLKRKLTPIRHNDTLSKILGKTNEIQFCFSESNRFWKKHNAIYSGGLFAIGTAALLAAVEVFALAWVDPELYVLKTAGVIGCVGSSCIVASIPFYTRSNKERRKAISKYNEYIIGKSEVQFKKQ